VISHVEELGLQAQPVVVGCQLFCDVGLFFFFLDFFGFLVRETEDKKGGKERKREREKKEPFLEQEVQPR
jgi:hypothetical protein